MVAGMLAADVTATVVATDGVAVERHHRYVVYLLAAALAAGASGAGSWLTRPDPVHPSPRVTRELRAVAIALYGPPEVEGEGGPTDRPRRRVAK
jgi:hypothetical protein